MCGLNQIPIHIKCRKYIPNSHNIDTHHTLLVSLCTQHTLLVAFVTHHTLEGSAGSAWWLQLNRPVRSVIIGSTLVRVGESERIPKMVNCDTNCTHVSRPTTRLDGDGSVVGVKGTYLRKQCQLILCTVVVVRIKVIVDCMCDHAAGCLVNMTRTYVIFMLDFCFF